MDFVFDDDDAAVVGGVDDELVGGLKRDGVDIAEEPGHQLGSPLDDARPTRDVVKHLVDHLLGDDVEEVLAVDQLAQRPTDQIEIGGGGLVGGVFRFRHSPVSRLSLRSRPLHEASRCAAISRRWGARRCSNR